MTIEEKIIAAYNQIVREPRDWVKLADLRDQVGESINRHEMDAAMIRMHREQRAILIPESNQKVLQDRDRWSAVEIGEQMKHLISIR